SAFHSLFFFHDTAPTEISTLSLHDALPISPVRRGDREVEDVQPVLVQLVDHEADDPVVVFGHHADAVPLAEAAEEVVLGPGVLEDRKSTRLNSSHDQISYAVFCLKKKINKT